MTDTTTKKPLRVSGNGKYRPYIRLPLSQVDEVRRLLDSHGISHALEEDAISMDGGPYIAVIDFGREADAAAIQAILDSSVE